MGWRRGELWFDPDLLWPREGAGAPAFAGVGLPAQPLPVLPPGLLESRRRRDSWKRRRYARRARATALALSPAVMLALGELRSSSNQSTSFAAEDPPSMTLRLRLGTDLLLDSVPAAKPKPVRHRAAPEAPPKIEWHHATSAGLPYGGSLIGGTQLPVRGPDWVTWSPITDSVPNAPERLYGNERTIRAIASVTEAYRAAHPHAPRVVVGDISRAGGGPMDDHISHQNGLDVDIYFPRVDRRLRAPRTPGQIDHRLAQDLVERFVAAGAQMIFVGFTTGLHGPKDVVIPYENHEYHMHVRFPPPGP